MAEPIDTDRVLAGFRQLADARGWHHNHSPRNLAAAVAVEAGELLSEFQWLADDAAIEPALRQRAGGEIADVLMYLLVLCDKLGLEPAQVVADKQRRNLERL